MLPVSLFVELLRTKPRTVFWAAALAQAALWVIVPTLFYAAPPSQAALVLAVGHEFQLGSDFGPPLAFWLAEIFFAVAGMFGVYLLSQICVVTTYWAVFTLGSAIVGERHAAMAVLLMVGVSVFSVPTPDFGPGILAAALWALSLLCYWRAVGQGERLYWYVLGFCVGLLALTSYAALTLVALLVICTLLLACGRAQLMTVEPWIAAVIPVIVIFPHLIWLDRAGGSSIAGAMAMRESLRAWGYLIGALALGHLGLGLLVALAWGITRRRNMPAPEIERPPIDRSARLFVYFFAIAPALAIALQVLITGHADVLSGAPLVVLSGLAVIAAAPDRIRIVHQHLTAMAWVALLVLPPLLVGAAVMLLPWTVGIDLRVNYPAAEMGRFFADNFQRRTGRPLAIVAGDSRTAALVALTAPSRPSLYFGATPERSPWVTRSALDEKGAVVIWPTTDTSGTPPAAIRERFPELVAEVPHAFERRFQGFLPLLRIGWGVIRPRGQGLVPPGDLQRQ